MVPRRLYCKTSLLFPIPLYSIYDGMLSHVTIVLFIVVVLDSARTVADGSYTLSLFYALLRSAIIITGNFLL